MQQSHHDFHPGASAPEPNSVPGADFTPSSAARAPAPEASPRTAANGSAPADPSILIAQLQRRVRRAERLGLAAVALAVVGGVGACILGSPQAPAPPDPNVRKPLEDAAFKAVTCRRFTVTDDQERPRLEVLTELDGSVRLCLRDTSHHERFLVKAFEADETALHVRDANETDRVVIGTLPEGACGIDVLDKEKQTRIALLVNEEGECTIGQADQEGLERISHQVSKRGNLLSLWRDQQGGIRLAMVVDDPAGCFMDVNDEQQRTRVRTYARNGGEAGIMQSDQDEKIRVFLGSDSDGDAYFHFWDGMDRLRVVGGTTQEDAMLPVVDVINLKDEKPAWSGKPSGMR